jgi:alcohol dehydrogenase class IV
MSAAEGRALNARRSSAADSALLLSPGRVLFGAGSVSALPWILSSRGRRVFACVDRALVGSSHFVAFLEAAPGHGLDVRVFDDFEPELPVAGVTKAIAEAQSHRPEILLGFGGGSAIDLAKLTSLGLSAGGQVSDYYGENRITSGLLPVVAVPTTAGTGSEVTPVAVVLDPARVLKVGVSSEYLTPNVAIVDPDLTRTCPASVTASSGMDALSHAIESYTSRPRSPDFTTRLPVFGGPHHLSQIYGVESAARIVHALPRVVEDRDDDPARVTMSYASLLAGMALATAGTHIGHAIQYPVGALTHTSHGLGVGLLLPHVMRACLPYATPELAELGRAFGSTADSDDAAAENAVETVTRVRDQVGVPATLADLGVRRTDLRTIVEQAGTVTRLVENAPGPDPQALLEQVVDSAWRG